MALLLTNADGTYETCCSLCDEPLSEPIFATSHFIADQSDRLYQYSDSGMHWGCYANWKYQRRFASQYFESVRLWKPSNPYWAIVAATDDFLLSANPNVAEPVAELDFKTIGPGFRVAISDWTKWVDGQWDADCVHDLQRYAITEVEAALKQVVPSSEVLMTLAREKLQATRGNEKGTS